MKYFLNKFNIFENLHIEFYLTRCFLEFEVTFLLLRSPLRTNLHLISCFFASKHMSYVFDINPAQFTPSDFKRLILFPVWESLLQQSLCENLEGKEIPENNNKIYLKACWGTGGEDRGRCKTGYFNREHNISIYVMLHRSTRYI